MPHIVVKPLKWSLPWVEPCPGSEEVEGGLQHGEAVGEEAPTGGVVGKGVVQVEGVEACSGRITRVHEPRLLLRWWVLEHATTNNCNQNCIPAFFLSISRTEHVLSM